MILANLDQLLVSALATRLLQGLDDPLLVLGRDGGGFVGHRVECCGERVAIRFGRRIMWEGVTSSARNGE